jgi:hypothetical protein
MDVNFIITCYDKELYFPYLEKIIKSYKSIKPNIVLCYSGENNEFLSDVKIKNVINGGRGNDHHEHACLYADSDYELTMSGYNFLKNNGVNNWVKLSVDSWLIDEDKIINIFEELESQECVYAGNIWYAHINLSTDIFFANTKKYNIFEDLEKHGKEFLDWLYYNKIPTGFENLMRYIVIPHDYLIINDREPLNADKTRWMCPELGWAMSHDLGTNISFYEKYIPNKKRVEVKKMSGNKIPFSMDWYKQDSGQQKKYYI